MKAKKIASAINANFSESFGFPPGFVEAKATDDGGLSLVIGWRDIALSKTGALEGAGTYLPMMQASTTLCALYDELSGEGDE